MRAAWSALVAQVAGLAHDAAPLVPVARERMRRGRLAAAHGVMTLAEVIAPETISGTSTHKITGQAQSHVLVVGTSTMENVAAMIHAADGARERVLGFRVPVVLRDAYDEDEELIGP